jgi:hypothetical protein
MAWPYLPPEDAITPWLQILEPAGLLRPGGVYSGDEMRLTSDANSTVAWHGYLGMQNLGREIGGRSSFHYPPAHSRLANTAWMRIGGGIAGEALGKGQFESRAGTWILAAGGIGSWGSFTERISVWAGSDEQPPYGFPSYHLGAEQGRHMYVDRGFFEAGAGSVDISLGRIPQRWGPGRFTSLLVSLNSPALDMLRFRWEPSALLTFTGFVASIESDSGRYLTAHRLDIWPSSRLRFGLSEAVLFQSRGLDLAYMNPLIPWYPVQWNEREDDNAFVSLDFTAIPLDGFAAWGELLVDDFQYQKEYHRPNKMGLTLGTAFAACESPVEATLEYTRIDRYVYSQKLPRNYYLHDDRIIGSDLGPDADRLTLSLTSPVLWPLAAELRASHQRAGEGTVYEGYPDSVVAGPFPSGVVENTTEAGLYLSWFLPAGFEAFASLGHVWTTNAGHERNEDEQGTEASAALNWIW